MSHLAKRAKVDRDEEKVLTLAIPSASVQCFITPELIAEISQYYTAQVSLEPQDFILLGETVRR